MWVTGFPGKETKREDISLCCRYFHQFRVDVNALLESGIIKRIDFDRYEWTENKISLAEYFKWLNEKDKVHVEGGFWGPVAKAFTIKGEPITRKSLADLASKYTDPKKNKTGREYSDSTIRIQKLVIQYREEVEQQTKLKTKLKDDFQVIKNLIEDTENNDDIQLLQSIREKIKNTLS